MKQKEANSKTTCFTLPFYRLSMGKVPFFSGKTTCFTGMTLYDTLRKRVIYPKHFGISKLAAKYDTLPKITKIFLGE